MNLQDEEGRSLVMLSIGTGGGLLEFLLKNGADPDISDAKGRTPLMIAATDEEVDPEVIDILLEFGADIDAADNKGLTALMWAVAGVDKIPNFMIPALIRTGGIRAKGWEKWCSFVSLYNSAKHELQIDAVKRLLERGADVNIFDKRGMNAMMYAIANDDYETADMLSDAGAQIIFDLT